MLFRSQEEQSAFISAASHELRTPLAVIQSCLQPFPSTLEESTHNQTIILHESKRMATLIEDMLTLSRADNNTWNFTFSDYPPETLLLNVFESFQPICKKNGMSLSLDLTEDNYTPILCDPIRMEQVLAILLNNAISYSSSPNSIELSLKQVGKKVRFQVIDHGIGIPKDQHDKVFKRFYRADASRHETNHFGLGLSIAKEIINAHNGSIRINDTPGGGTTVSVWL